MVAAEALRLQNVQVSFPVGRELFRAVDDISLTLLPGLFYAIVGESGCGKSVLGQAMLHSLPASARWSGEIFYGKRLVEGLLPELAVIPQDPLGSLNPTRRLGRQLQDILDVAGIADSDAAYKRRCLELFGLSDSDRVLAAYPHELSGGMLQRLLCAMAVCSRPAWILADEPTKGLDERVAAVVRENLLHIKQALRLSMLIITHDIALARDCCDEVLVMYAGQLLERSRELWQRPLHPYTQGFLAALPENGLQPMRGKAPAPGSQLAGCCFAPRCPHCSERCLQERPALYRQPDGAEVRCFLYADC